jgi:hypothetical protein
VGAGDEEEEDGWEVLMSSSLALFPEPTKWSPSLPRGTRWGFPDDLARASDVVGNADRCAAGA